MTMIVCQHPQNEDTFMNSQAIDYQERKSTGVFLHLREIASRKFKFNLKNLFYTILNKNSHKFNNV